MHFLNSLYTGSKDNIKVIVHITGPSKSPAGQLTSTASHYSLIACSLTPLHLDPLGLDGGHVEPLLCVALPDVVAGGESPQRVPGALVSPVGSHRSLVFRYG